MNIHQALVKLSYTCTISWNNVALSGEGYIIAAYVSYYLGRTSLDHNKFYQADLSVWYLSYRLSQTQYEDSKLNTKPFHDPLLKLIYISLFLNDFIIHTTRIFGSMASICSGQKSATESWLVMLRFIRPLSNKTQQNQHVYIIFSTQNIAMNTQTARLTKCDSLLEENIKYNSSICRLSSKSVDKCHLMKLWHHTLKNI